MLDTSHQRILTYILTTDADPTSYLEMVHSLESASLQTVFIKIADTVTFLLPEQNNTLSHPSCIVVYLSDQMTEWLKMVQLNKVSKPSFVIGVSEVEKAKEDIHFDLLLPIIPSSFLANIITTQTYIYLKYLQLQKGAQDLELLKNAIVHNVSHELKTPLLQVKSAIHLLAEETTDNKLTEMAIQSTARLESIVKNITLLSNTIHDKFSPILIQESIDHAIRHLRRSWQHKDAVERIRIQIDPHLPPALADKQAISIVIQQLLDNALKFSKGQVELNAIVLDQDIEISVIDYGIGIEQDKFNRIFESFYQVDSSTTRRYNGVGVGLAIAKYIVERHQSHIVVKSSPQHGSTFSFKLRKAQL